MRERRCSAVADAMAGGDMKLVSELQVPVVAETVITGSFEPARQ